MSTRIAVTLSDVNRAVSKGLLEKEQAKTLWDFWATTVVTSDDPELLGPSVISPEPQHRLMDGINVAYYAGALLVIGSMGWFMGAGWESFGGLGIFAISSIYALCFVAAGHHLWHKKRMRIPGGLLVTMAVCMTPLATYGFQEALGWPVGDPGDYQDFHQWINGGWLFMEIATLVTGAIALRYFRFPFLTAPIAFTFWYMSMDLAPLLFGVDVDWQASNWTSVVLGAAMLVVAFQVDRRTREDYAFWGYLFGLLAFSGGLTTLDTDSELLVFIYCLLNVGLLGVAVALRRRIFMVFGSLGVTAYISHLAWDVFENSEWFPFVLILIGLSIITAAGHYHQHRQKYEAKLLSLLPSPIRNRLPDTRVADSGVS